MLFTALEGHKVSPCTLKKKPTLLLNFVLRLCLFMFVDVRPVATPKQIRDMMKVDGLTNDEVKSHLQVNVLTFFLTSYRL